MTAGAINDPDLIQAIDDLEHVVRRLEQIYRIINELDPHEGYGRIVMMRTEREELRDRLRTRAEKLQLAPRALELVIATATRMRTSRKYQLPMLKAVLNRIEIETTAAARDQAEAEAEAKIAIVMARGAKSRVEAGQGAIAYLEASRDAG